VDSQIAQDALRRRFCESAARFIWNRQQLPCRRVTGWVSSV